MINSPASLSKTIHKVTSTPLKKSLQTENAEEEIIKKSENISSSSNSLPVKHSTGHSPIELQITDLPVNEFNEQSSSKEKQFDSEVVSFVTKINQNEERSGSEYSVSNNFHQKNSTTMSVTSKNITTANYLNQNNQFITSQPLPSRESFKFLNNEGQGKNGLEELERKLAELEKSTQIKSTSVLSSIQADLTLKNRNQKSTEAQERASAPVQHNLEQTDQATLNSNNERLLTTHILKGEVDSEQIDDSSPSMQQIQKNFSINSRERREESSQGFRTLDEGDYISVSLNERSEVNKASSGIQENNNKSMKSNFQQNQSVNPQTTNIAKLEVQNEQSQNVGVGLKDASPISASQNSSEEAFGKNTLKVGNEEYENIENMTSMSSSHSYQLQSNKEQVKNKKQKKQQLVDEQEDDKSQNVEFLASRVSPSDKETYLEISNERKSELVKSSMESEAKDSQNLIGNFSISKGNANFNERSQEKKSSLVENSEEKLRDQEPSLITSKNKLNDFNDLEYNPDSSHKVENRKSTNVEKRNKILHNHPIGDINRDQSPSNSEQNQSRSKGLQSLDSSNSQVRNNDVSLSDQGSKTPVENQNLYSQSLQIHNRITENNDGSPHQQVPSESLTKETLMENPVNEIENQTKQKSKKHSSSNGKNKNLIQRKDKNLERVQEDVFHEQFSSSEGKDIHNLEQENSSSFSTFQNKDNTQQISEADLEHKMLKQAKKKQLNSNEEKLKSNHIETKEDNNNTPISSSERKEEFLNTYSVYSRNNSRNHEEIREALENDAYVNNVKRDEKITSQSFKIRSENSGFENPQIQQHPDVDVETEAGNINQVRLSKMSEEQAAAFYEQRKNDIQKSMKKISKKQNKKSLKKDFDQPRITPTNKERYQENFAMISNNNFETPIRDGTKFNEFETHESGSRLSHHIIQKSSSPKKSNISSQSKKNIKTRSIHERRYTEENMEAQEQEGETLKKFTTTGGKRFLNDEREERNAREHTPTHSNTLKPKNKAQQSNKELRQQRENPRTQEHQRSPKNRSQERSSDFRKSEKQYSRDQKMQVKQKAEPEIVKSKDKFDNAIQVAREGILLRMENIDKALVKEDKISKDNIVANKNQKQNLRRNEVEFSGNEKQNDQRASIGQKKVMKTTIHSGQDTTKTPQSVSRLNVNKREALITKVETQDFEHANYESGSQNSFRNSSKPQNLSKTPKQNENNQINYSYKNRSEQIRTQASDKKGFNIENNIDEFSRENEVRNRNLTPNGNSNKSAIQTSEKTPRYSTKNNIHQGIAESKPNASYDEIPSTSKYFQNQSKTEHPNKPSKNQRTIMQKDSSIKSTSTLSKGANIASEEMPSNSQYNKNQFKPYEQINNETSPNRKMLIRKDTSTSKQAPSLSKGAEIAYDEIPSNSQYHSHQNQLKSSEQQKNRRTLSYQESFTENSLTPVNAVKERKVRQPISNINVPKQRKTESSSPQQFQSQERAYNVYNTENSFDERTRLWVIRKNQRLAENERKQYAQEQLICTFSPFSGKERETKKPSSSFYEKNVEWCEKIKTENLIKMEKELEEKQKREPRKPRQKISPFSPSGSTFSRRPMLSVDALKNDPNFQISSANKNLKAYLDYEWDDNILKEEINEIEDLYNYVKSLVKSRLNQTHSGLPDPLQTQPSLPLQRSRTNSFSYKHKNPISRANSLDQTTKGTRLQSLKSMLSIKKTQNQNEPQKKEKIQTSEERQIHDFLKNKENKRLEIINNQYVVIDAQNFE